MPKIKGKCSFQENWKEQHSKWFWLQSVEKDKTKAWCSLCKSTFDVANMGICSVQSHEKGKKHKDRVEASKISKMMKDFMVKASSPTTEAVACTSSDTTNVPACDILMRSKSRTQLLEIDLSNTQNLKSYQTIDIGFAASTACKFVKDIDVIAFRKECRLFLQHLCTSLFMKCPLSYKLVRGVSCLSPTVMQSETLRNLRVTATLEVLLEKKRISPSVADIIKKDYNKLCSSPIAKDMLQLFDKRKDSLDRILWTVLVKEKSSSELKSFVKQILVLFHGNAAVERSFSINKECLVENLLEDSLIAQRSVYDAVAAAGSVASISVTKEMLKAVRNASRRRTEELNNKRTADGKALNERKRMGEKIKELEIKKRTVVETAKEEANALEEEVGKLRKILKGTL